MRGQYHEPGRKGETESAKGEWEWGGGVAYEQFSRGFAASPFTSCVDSGMFLYFPILNVLTCKMG